MSFHPKNFDSVIDFCKVAKVQAFRYGQRNDTPAYTLTGRQCMSMYREHLEISESYSDEFELHPKIEDLFYDYEMENALTAWLEKIYTENPQLLPEEMAHEFNDLFLRTVRV